MLTQAWSWQLLAIESRPGGSMTCLHFACTDARVIKQRSRPLLLNTSHSRGRACGRIYICAHAHPLRVQHPRQQVQLCHRSFTTLEPTTAFVCSDFGDALSVCEARANSLDLTECLGPSSFFRDATCAKAFAPVATSTAEEATIFKARLSTFATRANELHSKCQSATTAVRSVKVDHTASTSHCSTML